MPATHCTTLASDPNIAVRFWAKVDKLDDGCWVWRGQIIREGYGICRMGKGRGMNPLAHRLAWELLIGPLCQEVRLGHRCPRLHCVNPAHLYIINPLGGEDLATRFWSMVCKTESCWLWTGPVNHCGYGLFDTREKSGVLAHRLAYELTYGGIPEGDQILHRCDTPPCVRPDHLVPGTPLDNCRDMIMKGRHQHGERHRSAKLTDEIVIAMRLRHAHDERTADLALEFGVAEITAYFAIVGRTWKHLPLHPTEPLSE